jgi:FkbM family methyltransferase
METWSRLRRAIITKNFSLKSKKISLLLRSLISNNKKLSFLDIGAGNRYLAILLNFDGCADVSMVDPHKNLFWSCDNLKKHLIFKDSVKPYKVGIGKKTTKKILHIGKKSTGSTFIDIFKVSKNKKLKIDMNYFSISKEMVQIFKVRDLLSKYKIKKPEIVKIDVEGLEGEVLESVLDVSRPFIIQIESNINSDLYGNTFDQIHQKLTSLDYNLATFHPSYRFSKYSSINKKLINDYYDYPKIRSKIVQSDSIYILKNKNTLRKIAILIGYGFLVEAFEMFKKIEKKIKIKDRNNLKIFFKKHIPKSILKTI